jgi:hypothetical protein
LFGSTRAINVVSGEIVRFTTNRSNNGTRSYSTKEQTSWQT